MTAEDLELERIVREFARDEKTPAAKKHYRARTGEWTPPPLIPDFDRRQPTKEEAARWYASGAVTGDTGPLWAYTKEEEK